MKYLKLYENIDFDDISEEEFEPNIIIQSNMISSYYEKFIGLKAIISDKSEYSIQNPKDKLNDKIHGTIIDTRNNYYNNKIINNDDHLFMIKWPNNYKNTYRITDIIIVN